MGDLYKKISNKLQWSLMPFKELEEVMGVIQFGANKYQPDGWKQSQNPNEFFDALMRHIIEWIKAKNNGQIPKDTDSGFNPLAHIIANALFLMYFDNKEIKNAKDNRDFK